MLNLITAGRPAAANANPAEGAQAAEAEAGQNGFAQLFTLAVSGAEGQAPLDPLALTASAAETPPAEEEAGKDAALAVLAQLAGLPALQPPAAGPNVTGSQPADTPDAAAATLPGLDPRQALLAAKPAKSEALPANGRPAGDAPLATLVPGGAAPAQTAAEPAADLRSELRTDLRAPGADAKAGARPGTEFSAELVLASRNGTPEAAAQQPQPQAAAHPAGIAPLAAQQPQQEARIQMLSAAVNAPVSSPQFAPELSSSVIVMAKDHIQSAQVQMNPREMGPVSIQLSLNGSEASVAFAAVQPDTRAAIEAALPVLKEMMLESGLQLTQSSVSDQHPREDRAPHGRGEGRPTNGEREATEAPAAAPARSIRVAAPGRIDLYA